MKNTAPHQNAHLHSQNPSPTYGETGSPKGGRRDKNPMPIPLGHRPLPILRREKTFLKTANNPSSRLREEVSRSDGGGQKRLSVLLGGPSNHTACGASVYPAWCVANPKFCTEKSLPPLAGEGGRRPEGGDKKPGFIPLGGPSNCAAWRAQQPHPYPTPHDHPQPPRHR